MLVLSPLGGAGAQFLDNNGNPLSGGKLYVYEAGTTTPAVTYTDKEGTVPHTNPIILDSAGRVPGGQVWITNNVSCKFTLATSIDVTVATWDNIVVPVDANVSGESGDFSGTLHSGGDLTVGVDKFGIDAETGDVTTPGAVTAGSVNADAVTAGSVAATGAVTAGSVAATGAVTAGSVAATGAVTADSVGADSVVAVDATFSGKLLNDCSPRAWACVRSDGFPVETVNCTVARTGVGQYEITMNVGNVFTSDGGALVSCNEGYPPRLVSAKRMSDAVYLVQVYTTGIALVDSSFTFVAFGY